MRRAALAMATCAALGGVGLAGATGCQLSLAAAVPMTVTETDKLLVPVTMDGTGLTMILDTGSESIMLNDVVARRAGREVGTGSLIGGTDETGHGFESGVGGSKYVTGTAINDLAVGRMHGAFNADVTNQVFRAGSSTADGVLGMAMLGNFDMDLDLAGNALRLYSTTGNCSAPAVALGEPIYAVKLLGGYRSEVRPAVTVMIGGQPFRALLDTGTPGVALFRHTGAAVGLVPGQGQRVRIQGVGGGIDGERFALDRLGVGPLTLRHVPVVVVDQDEPETDLLLGIGFMKHVHLWLSNSSRTLVMQYPPMPSPPIGALNQIQPP